MLKDIKHKQEVNIEQYSTSESALVDLFGSIIIQFSEECITVDRLGSASSMIMNGFLVS